MIDANLLLQYFNGSKTYKTKEEAVKDYYNLKIHTDGLIPPSLDIRRPNEPEDIKEFRKKIYIPKSQQAIDKVLTSLTKIRRSNDWKTQYKYDIPSNIPKGEDLQNFIENNYPIYDSIDNFLFDECLTSIAKDANAVICVLPSELISSSTELIKPFAHIATSDMILEYIENELCIIKSNEKHIIHENGYKIEKDIFIVFDKNEIQRWVQSKDGKYILDIVYMHNLNKLPCFRPRSYYKKNIKGDILWKSIIEPMYYELEECVREYSDLQAEKVLHIFSEKWQYTSDECKTCNGTGKTKAAGFSLSIEDCKSCKGTGVKVVSPFGNTVIKYDQRIPNSVPTPPAGYIQKDTEITKILTESVDTHIYKALSAINMQFLEESPLNQSGTAKEWDREETNSYIYKVASILVDIKKNIIYYINEMRYNFLIPKELERELLLPLINLPQKFDFITSDMLIEEYKKFKDAEINPLFLNSLESDIASKRFKDNPELFHLNNLLYNLDPLAGISEDEKTSRLQNKGISELDYIVSSNINGFIKRAMRENISFENLDYSKQIDIIQKYAQEIIEKNNAKAEILNNSLVQEDNE